MPTSLGVRAPAEIGWRLPQLDAPPDGAVDDGARRRARHAGVASAATAAAEGNDGDGGRQWGAHQNQYANWPET